MKIIKYVTPFFNSYLLNYLISFIPFYFIRKNLLKIFGIKIGKHSLLDMGIYYKSPDKLSIGNNSHINRKCMLDARGTVIIGNNVSIFHRVTICSAGHDYNSPDFTYTTSPIIIEDNVWIGLNAIILQGVKIKEGAVIAAGSIVTKDVDAYSIYAGIPAKKIGERNRKINYNCTRFAYYNNIRKPYFE